MNRFVLPLIGVLVLWAASGADGDPSGYLHPEGDRAAIEKASRFFKDGVALLEKGVEGGALGKFRKAAELCPDFFEARYNVAKLLGKRLGSERAVAELEAVCRDFPHNVRAFNDLGQLLIQADTEAAGRTFLTAVTNGEHLLQDETITAAGAGTRAQLTVDLAMAYHNRGAWCLSQGDYPAAETDLARSVELNSTNFFSHYALGLARLQQGKFEAARRALKEAKALKRTFPDCLIALARTYLGETPPQPAAAIVELREAGALTDTSADIELLFGDAYRLLGEADTALEHYRSALELGADAATISFKRALVARDCSDAKAAREHIDKCLEQTDLAVLRGQAYRLLGELAETESDFEVAADHFTAAIEADPTAHGARLHLGACLFRLDRVEEAEALLAAAIEACGDPPPAALAADVALARNLLDKIRHLGDNIKIPH